jgi:hypothetical protein
MLRQAPSRKSMGVEGIRQRPNRYAIGLRTNIRIAIRPSLLYGIDYFAGRISIVVEATIPRQASIVSSFVSFVWWEDPAAETVDVANQGRCPSSMLLTVLRVREPSLI